MTTVWKGLLIAAAVLALLAYAVAFVGDAGKPGSRHAAAITVAATTRGKTTDHPSTETAASVQATPVTEERAVVSIPPLPPDATTVPDDDLLRLSAMVDLANAPDHPPNKEQWRQAIPIAEKLQQGPCDCEQRNWLHHFVETGHSALTASADEYTENVQVMLKLARNDQQAILLSHKAP